jgi:hypothetical protein
MFTSLVTSQFYLGNLHLLQEKAKNLEIFHNISGKKERKILPKYIRDLATEAA